MPHLAKDKTQYKPLGFQKVFSSPDINCHQGYTTDGTYHYVIDTNKIYKYDSDWNLITSNTDVAHGTTLAGEVNVHCGDCHIYNGLIYIPAMRFVSCVDYDTEIIIVLNASDLTLSSYHDVSAEAIDYGGLYVDGANDIIYLISFCDSSKIWKYKLSDFSYIGTISISGVVPPNLGNQGIYLRGGYFYITNDLNDDLFRVDQDGQNCIAFFGSRISGGVAYEGLDWSQNELRILHDYGGTESVWYFKPQ